MQPISAEDLKTSSSGNSSGGSSLSPLDIAKGVYAGIKAAVEGQYKAQEIEDIAGDITEGLNNFNEEITGLDNTQGVCPEGKICDENGNVITFEEFWKSYPSSTIEHPSEGEKDLFDNHCAINLSECLNKTNAKISLNGVKCYGTCPSSNNHVIRAQELANDLKKIMNSKY